MGQYKLDLEKYSSIARQAVAESCVLLKNDDNKSIKIIFSS